ncbi:MAG: helix-turn-helix transcriptional regulator [Candidatus Obscuribacterales bacterium]
MPKKTKKAATPAKKHEHLYVCLGKVISDRRKKLGLSQEELAADSGVDRAFLSNVETGKRNPSIGSVASIAQGMKMRLSRLVSKCEQCQDDLEDSA